MPGIFLSAEWRNLAMLNYEVDPAILARRVPAGTELDLWQGRALVSLVGFMFLNTRVLGFPIPFHRNFAEVNLRFYIKRRDAGAERRAVAFVKELVPRWAIAFVARTFYNENYIALPMRHSLETHTAGISAAYEWRANGRWQKLAVRCSGDPALPSKGSEAEFITEHYWGYAAQRRGSTVEYQVAHPQWRTWSADEFACDADVKALYGEEFFPFLSKPPVSAFLAEGSAVTVSKGVRLTP
jgi:uncharacterized protein YqjF (DUF2071 family)